MTTLALVAIGALVLVNAFFVAAEFALVSVRADQLRGGSMTVRLARKQQEKLDEYLSACQLGITIASLALGALGEPTIAHLVEPVLDSVALAHVAGVVGGILAILVMTVLHITVGEQAPKSFAIGSAGAVARFCAVPLELFHRGLRPLVVALNTASNAVVRAFGGTPAASHAQQASLEELRQLIGGLTDEGELDRTDAQILQGVFTLGERTARDVMTPRTRIAAVQANDSVREALTSTREAGHSRFPLLDASGDLLGVVYGRELTAALLDGQAEQPARDLRHDILIVPPTLQLDILLARMKDERSSISAVVDEYGVLAGVVTIEDIVEEIVGEIWDEDDLPSAVRDIGEGRVVVGGDVTLLDLADFGVDLTTVDSTARTIGGVIQDSLGRVAEPGDAVSLGRVRARVLATAGGRITRVLLAVSAASTTVAA